MRTNIDIDDDLMREAQQTSGEPTKRAAEREARTLLRQFAKLGRWSPAAPDGSKRQPATTGSFVRQVEPFAPFERHLGLQVVRL